MDLIKIYYTYIITFHIHIPIFSHIKHITIFSSVIFFITYTQIPFFSKTVELY